MRFNCHTHIFNLKSVFTTQTLETFVNRLSREKWPDFVVEAVAKTLARVIAGDKLDDEQLARALIKQFSLSNNFKSYLSSLNVAIPADVSIVVNGSIDNLPADALLEQLRKIGDLITGNRDAENQTLSDLVDFLTTGIKPTISAVTDRLISLSGPETAVVALMMDITNGQASDEALFIRQMEDTSAAALAYPGRVLPFVAVNTQRASHFIRMDQALTQKGFVGVKLYPSLGYSMISPEMDRVFAYCATNDVPVLLHCNKGGFYRTKADIAFCDPITWNDILAKFPTLRVCFGHFGGDENLIKPAIDPDSWTAAIISLMKTYPGVYADIAFHTEPMAGGAAEKNYFAHLTGLLADAKTRDRLLFGSDFFLVRQRVREDNLWRYFEAQFTTAQFKRITETNPVAFLGLPAPDGTGARANIQRHLNWISEHRTDVQRIPAEWVLTAIEATSVTPIRFTPSGLGPAWSVNNQAHVATWKYLRIAQMYPSQQQQSFNDAGSLRLRDLMYWNKEHEAPGIFTNKCRLVASGLHDSLIAAGVRYEEGKTAVSTRKSLGAALADGDTPLHAFAASVDRLFRFSRETESPS